MAQSYKRGTGFLGQQRDHRRNHVQAAPFRGASTAAPRRSGFLDMRLCREVVRDAQFVINKYRPDLMPELALTLHRANFAGETARPASGNGGRLCRLRRTVPTPAFWPAPWSVTPTCSWRPTDSTSSATRWIGPPNTRLRVMTPHEALEWAEEQLRRQGQEGSEERD